MTKSVFSFTLLFIILVVSQVVVFNHLLLFNVAMPLVFIYFILRLPVSLHINVLFTLSFLIGLTIDIFSDTQGMNALACTLLAAMRRPLLGLYIPREDDIVGGEPSIRSLGIGTYMKYLLTFTFVYCALYFIIESFSFFDFSRLMLRILFSTVLTFVLILGIDSLCIPRNAKRL